MVAGEWTQVYFDNSHYGKQYDGLSKIAAKKLKWSFPSPENKENKGNTEQAKEET